MAGPGDKIIVAMDTPNLEYAKTLMKKLKGIVSYYKVGFELFTAHGWTAVDLVKKYGGRIFLDLKLHDIPNTVSKAAAVICEHEVDMITVHAMGGFEMMKKTRETILERTGTGKKRPMIVGVTVLTSHSDAEMRNELGIGRSLNDQVEALAALAHKAGLDGIVSSPLETRMLRSKFPKDFIMITPGVRPVNTEKSDQKRTVTPREAMEAGADYLVIGRPITDAKDPKKAAQDIISSLQMQAK